MTTDYTTSPACQMIAVSCACCGRELLDATSVETGVGPDCRRKHGFTTAQGSPNWPAADAALADEGFGALTDECVNLWGGDEAAARRVVNCLVHRIACLQDGPLVGRMADAIDKLGYSRLAARILERVASVQIELAGDQLVVTSQYSEAAVAVLRRVPGRRWDGERKVNTFPVASKRALWGALQLAYPGRIGRGPAGVFVIAAGAAA